MTNTSNSGFVITAFWETREGEETAIAGLLRDFLPKAQQEPWVKQFQIHQNAARPREFLFYEVFADEAGFADHQQTEHFKAIIQAQALPRLTRRERNQFRFI
jgi:quinol monooxygenase YgiN